jgi:hypothetical protein
MTAYPLFNLVWCINDGDRLPIRNAPTGMTRYEARRCLHWLFQAARAAGCTAEVVDMDGTFVVRRGGDVARVWAQQVSGSAVEWQESA